MESNNTEIELKYSKIFNSSLRKERWNGIEEVNLTALEFGYPKFVWNGLVFETTKIDVKGESDNGSFFVFELSTDFGDDDYKQLSIALETQKDAEKFCKSQKIKDNLRIFKLINL